MSYVADSSVDSVASAYVRAEGGTFENGLPQFYTSVANVAMAGADLGSHFLPAVRVAATLSWRASALGEGRIDTIWALRTLGYVKCSVALMEHNADPGSLAKVRRWPRDVEEELNAARSEAAAERSKR